MALLDFLSKPFAPNEDIDDSEFMNWYSNVAEKNNLSSDPYSPRHYYDYKAAYEAGASLDKLNHLPSEFKHDLHPNRYIVKDDLDIYDTKYGRPAKFEDLIMQSFQRKEFEEEIF